jgi:aldehyde dehydrogenase (NAD+)
MPKFEYAPAPESRSIVSLRESYGLFINGEFSPGVDGHAFKTISPATEEVLAEVTEAGAVDVDRAVTAARKAYEQTWSVMPGRERAKYLFRIARIVQERARELAVLESLDNGKPIRESRDVDIPLVAAHFFYHAGWADKLEYAGYGPAPRPLGVAGQVIPWNFPMLMLAWKIAPALACGNTLVLKPAETTPLTALAFAEICQQADLPPGVVNIVTGAGETGRALVEHPGIDKVAFTGSTEVGKQIARACAPTRKKVTLELGGKAANVVFEDAPVDQAVEGIVNGIFFGSATRWIRTPTSAPSTPPPSWPRSASCPRSARPRARSAGRRPASCRSRASGSRPRSSPGCRRRTASRGRRSSARCSRC